MHLKDSLTGKSIALPDGEVSVYACGITPYSAAHVGHARTYVVFDMLAKTLRAEGRKVRLIRNITDIDDKIIKAAEREGVTWKELSQRYAAENRNLMRATGVAIPEEPCASDFIPDIIEMVQKLLELGHAYVAGNGDVLYRASSFKGRLLMEHEKGALKSDNGQTRVDASGKEDERDFALWKLMSPYTPGFDSPWGFGRPGWHIECSAMIGALLGGSVTIHGGGVDLKFPHHNAEICQSEPVFGKPVADIWMHNGSVNVGHQKMGKSMGNFITWQKVLDDANAMAPGLGGELLRYGMLMTHWQKPLLWADDLMHQAMVQLVRVTKKLSGVKANPQEAKMARMTLDSNFNTPALIADIHNAARDGDLGIAVAGLELMGISVDRWASLRGDMNNAIAAKGSSSVAGADILAMQEQRKQAREQGNWALADELRAKLRAAGMQVNDN